MRQIITKIHKNLWEAAKAALSGKFVAVYDYTKKEGRSQINTLTLLLKKLEKEEQIKFKVRRRKEIIIRAECEK